jgi:phosphoribosylformylglycinamidine cyclo-ligase
MFAHYLASKYPESYDPEIPENLVYSGSVNLTAEIESLGLNAGKLILSPTRTYAPVIKRMLEYHRRDIHGMVHCSGGGQTKVLHFINDLHVVKDNLFSTPLLFQMIMEQSGTEPMEMYRVFNMGHRFEIYVPPAIADDIIRIAESFDIEARIVGSCKKGKGKKLTIIHEQQVFTY